MDLIFTIPGEPAYAARARAVAIGGHARMYNPKQNVITGKVIRDYAVEAMQGAPPYEGPVALTVTAYFNYPPSWSRPKRERARGWKSSKPDASNILKHVEDNLNAIVWRDDAQVTWAVIEKRYGTKAYTQVKVEAL
jgi:Holliday junction resolvase RusA-like endonuclease